ncbi:MAG: Tol-Pal system beta propeller repeat protein TolB [Pseudomonadota bacterium]
MTTSRRQLLLSASGAAAAATMGAGLGGWSAPASAQGGPLEITVRGGEFKPIPIAIAPFRSASPGLETLAADVTEVIAADLERSGLFRLVNPGPVQSIDVTPAFDVVRTQGADAIAVGEALLDQNGRLAVRFRLWDATTGQQLEQIQYTSDPTGWRRISHKVADKIYSTLTGEDPYFDSRIVFVDERGAKNARRKRLAIMDSDGANVAYLTDDRDLVLTPRFSPARQQITFISYAQGAPQIFLLDLASQNQQLLGTFPGMTFAPRFSPDGDRVALSLTRGGRTNIYLMDLASRKTRPPLTRSTGIDTGPSFSPDGRRIVFESDRGGSQQLYVMDADGLGQTRISFGGGRYGTPVWSPRGDLIAFTKIAQGRFGIGVMRPDGSEEQILTSSFLDEGPTWSPNGRVILFFRETGGAQGRPELFTVDVTGRNLRRLSTPAGASDPAWSGLLTA